MDASDWLVVLLVAIVYVPLQYWGFAVARRGPAWSQEWRRRPLHPMWWPPGPALALLIFPGYPSGCWPDGGQRGGRKRERYAGVYRWLHCVRHASERRDQLVTTALRSDSPLRA
jgi:hypothetical protein